MLRTQQHQQHQRRVTTASSTHQQATRIRTTDESEPELIPPQPPTDADVNVEFIPLSTADVFRWLEDEGLFIRAAPPRTPASSSAAPLTSAIQKKAKVRVKQESDADGEGAGLRGTGRFCPACGMEMSAPEHGPGYGYGVSGSSDVLGRAETGSVAGIQRGATTYAQSNSADTGPASFTSALGNIRAVHSIVKPDPEDEPPSPRLSDLYTTLGTSYMMPQSTTDSTTAVTSSRPDAQPQSQRTPTPSTHEDLRCPIHPGESIPRLPFLDVVSLLGKFSSSSSALGPPSKGTAPTTSAGPLNSGTLLSSHHPVPEIVPESVRARARYGTGAGDGGVRSPKNESSNEDSSLIDGGGRGSRLRPLHSLPSSSSPESMEPRRYQGGQARTPIEEAHTNARMEAVEVEVGGEDGDGDEDVTMVASGAHIRTGDGRGGEADIELGREGSGRPEGLEGIGATNGHGRGDGSEKRKASEGREEEGGIRNEGGRAVIDAEGENLEDDNKIQIQTQRDRDREWRWRRGVEAHHPTLGLGLGGCSTREMLRASDPDVVEFVKTVVGDLRLERFEDERHSWPGREVRPTDDADGRRGDNQEEQMDQADESSQHPPRDDIIHEKILRTRAAAPDRARNLLERAEGAEKSGGMVWKGLGGVGYYHAYHGVMRDMTVGSCADHESAENGDGREGNGFSRAEANGGLGCDEGANSSDGEGYPYETLVPCGLLGLAVRALVKRLVEGGMSALKEDMASAKRRRSEMVVSGGNSSTSSGQVRGKKRTRPTAEGEREGSPMLLTPAHVVRGINTDPLSTPLHRSQIQAGQDLAEVRDDIAADSDDGAPGVLGVALATLGVTISTVRPGRGYPRDGAECLDADVKRVPEELRCE